MDAQSPSLPNNNLSSSPLTPPIAKPISKKGSAAKYILLVVFVLLVLVAFAGGTLVAAAYMPETFSFVPTKVRLASNSVLGNLPLPKNLEQVLINTAKNKTAIKSNSHTAFLQVVTSTTDDEDNVFSDTTALRIDGKYDALQSTIPEVQESISALIDGDSYEGMMQLGADVSYVDKVVYARVNSLPLELIAPFLGPIDSTGADAFKDIIGKWFSFDTSVLEGASLSDFNYFDVTLPSTESVDTTQIINDLYLNMLQSDYYNYLMLLDNEPIDGRDSYHIQLNKTGEQLKPLVKNLIDFFINEYSKTQGVDAPVYTEQDKEELTSSLNMVDRVLLDVWIDTNTSVVNRMTATATVRQSPVYPDYDKSLLENLPEDAPAMPASFFHDSVIEINFGMELSDVNEPQNITAPTNDASPLEGLFMQFIGSSMDSANDAEVRSRVSQLATVAEAYYTYSGGIAATDLSQIVDAGFLSPAAMQSLSEGDQYLYLTDGTQFVIIAKLNTPTDPTSPYYSYNSNTGMPGTITEAEYQNFLNQFGVEDPYLNLQTLGVMDIIEKLR